MPTAARLVAAIFLSLSAALVVMVTITVYPGLDRELIPMAATAGITGFLFGWGSLGKKVVDEKLSTFTIGLRVGTSVYIWTLFFFALKFMITGMLVHAYYQPMTAILQIPRKMIQYILLTGDVRIIGAIVIGSMISAAIARRAHLRWDIAMTD